jgi:bla regulator protein BlaR1
MMSEFQSFLGTSVAPAVANHLWQSTVFAAAAWLMTLLLRANRAQVRYKLWLAASIKFLVPFSLLIGLGGILPKPQHTVIAAQPALYSAVNVVAQPFSGSAVPPVMTRAARLRERINAWLPIALSTVWFCGAVTVLLVWYARWRQVSASLRRAVPTGHGREAKILYGLEKSGHRQPIPLLRSQEMMEPGIFGIVNPVFIWPERLSELLEDEHIEAILIHEMTHAQRRDNLTAALHMLVEAVFWFHPMVWWMERRMVEERERACDEAVVEMGSKPGIYAEGLLKACRFCLESPLVCVSGITGADLSQRIRSIMTLHLENLSASRKIILATFGLVAIAAPVAFGVVRMTPMYGQILHATAPRPSFAVASIRPSPSDEDTRRELQADSFTTRAMTLKQIISYAYGITFDHELSGGPNWVRTDKFDIEAKPDETEAAALSKLSHDDLDEQMRLMVQSLLAERFKLTATFQKKELPVYELVIAKGGLKCTKETPDSPLAAASPPRFRNSAAPPPPPPPPGYTQPTPDEARALAQQPLRLRTKGWPFWLVVTMLSHQPELDGRMVVDKTGLDGSYDCQASWSREGSDGTGPSFFTAIQEQMGLKLEPAKGPVEILLIDHIELPSKN